MRRVASLIALIGIAVVAGYMAKVWPRKLAVRYLFPPDVARFDVDYTLEGEAMLSARFVTEGHETGSVSHELELQPGEYEAEITVYDAAGVGVVVTRPLIVPTDGEVRFDLRP
jgi:hypothetical protein